MSGGEHDHSWSVGRWPVVPPLQETTAIYRQQKQMSLGLGNTNGPEWSVNTVYCDTRPRELYQVPTADQLYPAPAAPRRRGAPAARGGPGETCCPACPALPRPGGGPADGEAGGGPGRGGPGGGYCSVSTVPCCSVKHCRTAPAGRPVEPGERGPAGVRPGARLSRGEPGSEAGLQQLGPAYGGSQREDLQAVRRAETTTAFLQVSKSKRIDRKQRVVFLLKTGDTGKFCAMSRWVSTPRWMKLVRAEDEFYAEAIALCDQAVLELSRAVEQVLLVLNHKWIVRNSYTRVRWVSRSSTSSPTCSQDKNSPSRTSRYHTTLL